MAGMGFINSILSRSLKFAKRVQVATCNNWLSVASVFSFRDVVDQAFANLPKVPVRVPSG